MSKDTKLSKNLSSNSDYQEEKTLIKWALFLLQKSKQETLRTMEIKKLQFLAANSSLLVHLYELATNTSIIHEPMFSEDTKVDIKLTNTYNRSVFLEQLNTHCTSIVNKDVKSYEPYKDGDLLIQKKFLKGVLWRFIHEIVVPKMINPCGKKKKKKIKSMRSPKVKINKEDFESPSSSLPSERETNIFGRFSKRLKICVNFESIKSFLISWISHTTKINSKLLSNMESWKSEVIFIKLISHYCTYLQVNRHIKDLSKSIIRDMDLQNIEPSRKVSKILELIQKYLKVPILINGSALMKGSIKENCLFLYLAYLYDALEVQDNFVHDIYLKDRVNKKGPISMKGKGSVRFNNNVTINGGVIEPLKRLKKVESNGLSKLKVQMDSPSLTRSMEFPLIDDENENEVEKEFLDGLERKVLKEHKKITKSLKYDVGEFHEFFDYDTPKEVKTEKKMDVEVIEKKDNNLKKIVELPSESESESESERSVKSPITLNEGEVLVSEMPNDYSVFSQRIEHNIESIQKEMHDLMIQSREQWYSMKKLTYSIKTMQYIIFFILIILVIISLF